MKKLIIPLLIALLFSPVSKAQLIKKIKEKTQKVLEPKNENTTPNNNNDVVEIKKEKIWTPSPTEQMVFSLENDEQLFYDETEVIVKNNKTSYSFVVMNKKYEYFLIEDGKRSGPFKEAPIKSLKNNDDESSSISNDDAVNLGSDKKDPVALQYTKTINNKLYIVFNGKNYGPYDYVSKMILSRDKKQFFALVTIGGENAMTTKMGIGFAFMVNEGALKQKAGSDGMSMPMKFSVSPGFKHCMVTLMDQKEQKVTAITSTGKQAEGSMTDLYSGNGNNSFVNDNGDIVSVPSQSPTQVLVNGNEVAAFKVPIKNMNRLFLTPDFSKSVYYEKGKLYRADGTEESLSDILFPKVITINNETAVYYFKIFKNESGVKDVYLCKKVI
jgi:hypothetical protein